MAIRKMLLQNWGKEAKPAAPPQKHAPDGSGYSTGSGRVIMASITAKTARMKAFKGQEATVGRNNASLPGPTGIGLVI
jgi:hypothetical protein